MADKVKLGEMLVNAALITDEQLRMALDFQRSVGGRLGAIIVKLGFIEDETLMNFIARQQEIPLVDLKELVIPENLVKKIPRKLIERHMILPIGFKNGVLTIVTSDPFDFEAMEELQLAVDYKIEINMASRESIGKVVRELFPKPGAEGSTGEVTIDEIVGEGTVREKMREPTEFEIRQALIPLLIDKGIITHDELRRMALDRM